MATRGRKVTHNLSHSRIYRSWAHLKERCDSPNCKNYGDYGGRGISYCEKWKTFDGFYNDMGDSYEDGLTIDRIDNNGNYTKDNCRWATKQTQANNVRSNVRIEYNGRSQTVSEWAKELGLIPDTLYMRIKHGWSIPEILSPIKRVNQYL